jgi:hypothetical protein
MTFTGFINYLAAEMPLALAFAFWVTLAGVLVYRHVFKD